MKFRKLGTTDIDVSLICLGTMTWGTQNTEKDAFEQMDYAVSQGINFFDTAEIYSVPPTSDSYGKTEVMIGNWFEKRKNRDKIILASTSSCLILFIAIFNASLDPCTSDLITIFNYSLFFESIIIVTGPSLISETFMSAPKVPVFTLSSIWSLQVLIKCS